MATPLDNTPRMWYPIFDRHSRDDVAILSVAGPHYSENKRGNGKWEEKGNRTMGKRLIILACSMLIVLSCHTYVCAQQNAYIIVHAHNPEGKEIYSIAAPWLIGDPPEIYDGDIFRGYCADDEASHNQPLTLSSGSHTIKVKFNGMALEQNIDLQPNETQILIFTFERVEYPLEEIIRCFTTSQFEAYYITIDVDIPIQGFDHWWIQCFTEPDPSCLSSWFYYAINHGITLGYCLIPYGCITTVDAHETYSSLSFWTYYVPNWTLKMSSVPYDLLGTGVGEGEKKPPIASFTYSPEKPMVGGNIEFDATSSHDPDGIIVSYQWGFGDGNTAEGNVVTHTYTKAGEYTVTLTVTDDDGFSDMAVKDVQVCCCDIRNAKSNRIDIPTCAPFKCRGGRVVGPIWADSGERLELWWVWEWRFLPVPHFELLYFRPGAGEGLSQGFRVGQCHFPEGCNSAHYVAPDNDKNGKPDCFIKILWSNWDFGYDDGVKGYLDQAVHIYDVCNDKYSLVLFLYQYPEGCNPPVSSYSDVCSLKKECKGPYELCERRVIADPPLGPETEAIFDQLLLELQGVDPNKIVMGGSPFELCDMEWDGDCDREDCQIMKAALGSCWEEDGYFSLADVDADGCVTSLDMELILGTREPELTGDGVVNLVDLSVFALHWPPDTQGDWCGRLDFDTSCAVDWFDLAVLAEHWLEGISP